jgi:hypothetical protein
LLEIQLVRVVRQGKGSGIRLVHKACGGGPAKSLKTEVTKNLVLTGPQSKGFGPAVPDLTLGNLGGLIATPSREILV